MVKHCRITGFSTHLLLIILLVLIYIFGISSSSEGLVRVKRSSLVSDILDKVISVETLLKEMKSAQSNDQLISKCMIALDEDNLIAANKYWKRAKVIPGSNATESNLNTIITDVYRGKGQKIPTVLKFIESNNITSSSNAYKTFLQEMKDYGDLYITNSQIPTSGELSDFKRYTFSTLRKLINNLDILRLVGTAATAILEGKNVTLKNKLTGNALFMPKPENCSRYCTISTAKLPMEGDVNKFLWRFIPIEGEFKNNNELFYIENSSGDGRLTTVFTIVDSADTLYHANWVQFFVHLVSETEIMIQCSYSTRGTYHKLKTFIMDEDNVTPNLVFPLNGAEVEDTARWIVEVFEK